MPFGLSPAANLLKWWKKRMMLVFVPSPSAFAVAPIGDDTIGFAAAATPVTTQARPSRTSSYVLPQNWSAYCDAPGSGVCTLRFATPSNSV